MKQPTNYREWRRLYQSLAMDLGWLIYWNVRQRRPLMNREVWRLCRQMYRVQLQLDAEAEAFTNDYCRAFAEMIARQMAK